MKPKPPDFPKAEAKNKDEKPGWTRRVPIYILLLAIVTSMLSMLQGFYNPSRHFNRAMLKQIEAQDLWSLYNSKDVKNELRRLETDILSRENLRDDENEKVGRYLDYSLSVGARASDQLSREKNLLYFQAKKAEQERDHHLADAREAFRMDKRLASAIFLFQISIMFFSVSSLVENKTYYHLGGAVTVMAVVMLYNAFFPFIEIAQ